MILVIVMLRIRRITVGAVAITSWKIFQASDDCRVVIMPFGATTVTMIVRQRQSATEDQRKDR